MILHLVTDEKFTDYAIQQFSAPEMESEFVLLPSNALLDKGIVTQLDKVKVYSPWDREFREYLSNLDHCTAIVFHGMHWGGWQKYVLAHVPEHVKVAWVFWGGEIYGRNDCKDTFLAPITKFVCGIRALQNKGWRKKQDYSWQLPMELYQRVDYCLSDELEEFNYAQAFTKNSGMKYMFYIYYSIEETLGALIDSKAKGKNIWLGNSATSTNNFFDALWYLWHNRRLLGKDSSIIVPLSYGSPWVMSSIQKFGRFLFGNRFISLLDYLPRDEYNSLMLDCGTMVMAHYNPQAQGNILTGLWLGMRVYMSEHSMSYTFLKRIGVKVFSLESEFQQYGTAPLMDEIVNHNRTILMQWYGKDHVMQAAKEVVNELREPKK